MKSGKHGFARIAAATRYSRDGLAAAYRNEAAFRQLVWSLLETIPYGTTLTYRELARQAAARLGRPTMSAQAVGGAVGHNPLSVIIPCHRVVASDGSLTGYAGGVWRKAALLAHEGVILP